MSDRSEQDLLQDVLAGDEAAFEAVYRLYAERARLIAWRVSHRGDWRDDLFNEAWCRAYKQRLKYDPSRPFLVWYAGILRNVYREFCRESVPEVPDDAPPAEDSETPEQLVHEAEVLAGLNACVNALADVDAEIIRLRFFQGKTLRFVSQQLKIPEATLRESRIPAVLDRLRRCLRQKEIDFSEIFSAQQPAD